MTVPPEVQVTSPSLNRRALLTGGAGLAGAAWLVTSGTPRSAAAKLGDVRLDAGTPTTVVYAPPPSGGDDTAALQAALPTTGVLSLLSGTYLLAGQLTVGLGQDLVGAGGGYGKSATVLQCTTAGAGLIISAGGGISSGFRVDGNSIATQPFLRNGGIGSWVGRTFQGITVINSAQDGITCLGCQNDAWYNVVGISSARDGWVFDQGYGGAVFSRCEFADAGRYNIRFDTQISGGPQNAATNHVFQQCFVEYTRSSTVSMVYLNAAARIKFDHTTFYASVAPTGPMITVTGQATDIVIEDVLIQNTTATQGGIGIQLDTGCQLICTGFISFQNLTTPIYLLEGNPSVEVGGLLQYNNCASRYGAASGINLQSCISSTQSELLASQRTSTSDLSYASLNPSGGGYYTFENVTGRKVWGAGSDYVGDVALSRRDVGVLGVDKGQLIASGYGNTATRPAVTGLMTGAIRYNTDTKQLEVTDGGIWYAPGNHTKAYAASATFVVPLGITTLRCQAFGGGGGGGGGANIGLLTLTGMAYGGAGGGAGMTMDTPITVVPGDTLTIMIGAGGGGGAGAAACPGLVGGAGANGGTGGTTYVLNGAGKVLICSTGGGGGAGAPGAGVASSSPPAGGGAFGSPDLSPVAASPGCGSFAGYNGIPTLNGLCGGASGAPSSSGRGGNAGSGPMAQGQRSVAGGATNLTPNGSTGASPLIPGCGGNGGGAGGSGGVGGNGGNGTAGALVFWWVS
jgi:hypothetical protein